MKAYWGNRSIALRILNLGIRWTWVVSFMLRSFYPQGKIPYYPLDRRLGWTESRSGRSSEEKISQSLPWFELPIIQPLVQRYTTEVSRLNSFCGYNSYLIVLLFLLLLLLLYYYYYYYYYYSTYFLRFSLFQNHLRGTYSRIKVKFPCAFFNYAPRHEGV
jgi:hypothetical protein